MNKDQVKGTIKDAAEQVEGQAQRAVGDIKQAVKDANKS
jgi:uncharacterized protein YjbJ (UPF0337 family)